jgi:hypothetical protein
MLVAAGLAVPLLAQMSRAQDPPEPPAEVVVTAADLDMEQIAQNGVFRVVVASTGKLGYFFTLVGTNEAFDMQYLRFAFGPDQFDSPGRVPGPDRDHRPVADRFAAAGQTGQCDGGRARRWGGFRVDGRLEHANDPSGGHCVDVFPGRGFAGPFRG